MSLAKRKIPAALRIEVRFLKDATTWDEDGYGLGTPTEVVAGVAGMLQPNTGELQIGNIALTPKGEFTFFPEERVAVVVEHMLMEAPDGRVYRVKFVHDFGDPAPEEFDLDRVTDPKEEA